MIKTNFICLESKNRLNGVSTLLSLWLQLKASDINLKTFQYNNYSFEL